MLGFLRLRLAMGQFLAVPVLNLIISQALGGGDSGCRKACLARWRWQAPALTAYTPPSGAVLKRFLMVMLPKGACALAKGLPVASLAGNRSMITRALLERVQENAVFVLASRARVVDFEALTELALAGRFKLATDVFPEEPLPPDHPIRSAEGAILSAHRAGSVAQGLVELGEMVVDDLEAVIQGLPPRRLQMAEPELSRRYASNRAKAPE